MNWDIVKGNWKQFKGKVKAQWGKLTDDHLDVIAGKRDELAGKIQETYGITKDEAEEQIKRFEERNKDDLSQAFLLNRSHRVRRCAGHNVRVVEIRAFLRGYYL
jgi:uncharacterized protein YjbJ (UPF0337 family)